MTTIALKPRDAFKVTGVTPELQRSWRASGLLPRLEDGKRAEFGLADIVRLAAIKTAARYHFALPPITRPLENFLAWVADGDDLKHTEPDYLILIYTANMPPAPEAVLIEKAEFGAWMQARQPLMCCVLRISELAAEVRDAAVAMLQAEDA